MSEENKNIENPEKDVNVNKENQENKEPDKEVKMFTQDEVNKLIEKRLAKEKAKAEKEKAEAEKLAQMNAEEKTKYELEKQKKELEQKIAEYNRKELKQESINILTEKGYSIQTARSLSEFLNYENAEVCKASIDEMDKILKSCVDQEVKNKLKATNNVAPKTGTNTGGPITWEQVVKDPRLMSKYKQQQKKK